MTSAIPEGPRDKGFRYVATDLRRRIFEQEWKPGAPLPSLRKLALEYGVGLKTIRLAAHELRLQGKLSISRRHRLLIAEVERAWVPTKKPILLVLGSHLSKAMRGTYSREFLNGLFESLEAKNHDLLIFQGAPARRQKPHDLLDRPLHGVVLFGMLGKSVVAYYQNLDCPVVLADRPLAVDGVHRVLADNIRSAYQATQQIFNAGHRNVMLSFQKDPDAMERRVGFMAALSHRGIKRRSGFVLDSRGNIEKNRKALRKLFTGRNRCTAALATGEHETNWISEELSQMGLQIPQDVSLVGIYAKTNAPPKFTGQQIDFREMGRKTYTLLSEPKKPALLVRLAPEWVDAGTLAPPVAQNA